MKDISVNSNQYPKEKKHSEHFALLRGSFVFLFIGLLYACKDNHQLQTPGQQSVAAVSDGIPDNGEVRIMRKWELPPELREISGLSSWDANHLVCVQDEAATIYMYNIADSKIERTIQFGEPGDYEGLAVVGKDVWVLRADGKLVEVKNIESAKPAIQEYSTPLSVQQDCEGLCYDAKNKRLLVTVKERDPNSSTYKGIYAFDLGKRTLDETPVYKINLEDPIFANASSGKKKKNVNGVKPSGIAIHPVSHELYITDGPKSRLLVMEPSGKVKLWLQLDPKEFAQPEGIIFNAKGDLYISNEGPNKPGNILQVTINAN